MRTDAPSSPPDLLARAAHPRVIRWTHWLNVPILAVMVWSGLRIYWANDVYAAGIGSWEVFAFFPDGFYAALGLERKLAKGIAFHLNTGWLFVLNGAVYVAYLLGTRQWRHLVPDRHDARDAVDVVLHDVHLRADAPPHGRYNAAQKIAYTGVLLLPFLIVGTGFAIYKPTQLSLLTGLFGGYETARLIHFWTTIGFSAFVALHLVQVARSGIGNLMSMVTGFEYSPAPDEQSTGDSRPEEVST